MTIFDVTYKISPGKHIIMGMSMYKLPIITISAPSKCINIDKLGLQAANMWLILTHTHKSLDNGHA